MAENVDFFSDKKKVNYTLTGICVAALFFVLVCPIAKVSMGWFGSGSVSFSLYLKAKAFAGVMFILLPLVAAALTYFAPQVVASVSALKNVKTARWIFGAILVLPFFFFLFNMEAGLSMGAGVILYLLLSIAYFVVNFLSKE